MHKILLVDDMRHFLDLTSSFLGRADCQLLTAGTGLEAIKVAKRELPDLILLDIEMPEMNGIDACRIMKADPTMKKIPIVMLTSLAKEAEARKAGADHFLNKPIDEEKFLTEIRKFLPITERKDQRIEVTLSARASINGADNAVTMTDLSKSGTFIKGLYFVPPMGEQFVLSFELPVEGGAPKQLSPRVVVVRAIPDRGVGLRFLNMTSGASIFLEEFVSERGGEE